MPKLLFYAGTAFCIFLALTSAGELSHQLRDGSFSFVALPDSEQTVPAILTALAAGLAVSGLFLRMAALLAARNLFAALVAVLSVTAAVTSLTGALFLQWRIASGAGRALDEMHLAALMTVGFFVSLSLLALRPYFSIQASRSLSAVVFLPLPLYAMAVAHEMLAGGSRGPLPAATAASRVYFAVLAFLFLAIAVHCIRHRHLFLEMTNLRELLDSRIDPGGRGRTIGGVAFDS